MKIKELLEELKEKDSYKEFIKENPESFFCSAMFITGNTDKIDLNFFLPDKNKISTFSIPFATLTNHQEEIKKQTEIKNLSFKVDIDNLKQFIEDKTNKIFTKIIAILQKGIWDTTCLNGLNINRININAYTGKIKERENGNIMDIVKFRKKPTF